jgi:hypothetical protein
MTGLLNWCEGCRLTTSHRYTEHGWLKCVACGFVGMFVSRDGTSIDLIPDREASCS